MVRRTRVVRDYPTNTLQDVLVVPMAIHNNNAGLPIDRKLLAKSLGTTHKSSGFITKINSSFSYGLTIGGYKDELISLTGLGKSIVAPKNNEEYVNALIKSVLTPPIFNKIYKVLEGKILPGDMHMINLLEREFDMPSQISSECLEVLKFNGVFVELIKETVDGFVVINRESFLSESSTGNKESIAGGLINSNNEDSTTGQILLVSDVSESGSLDLIHGFLETINIKYVKLPILNFESIAENNNNIEKNYYLKTSQCRSAIIYLKNTESKNNQDALDINLMLNLGALFYRYDMKVVVILENLVKLSDFLKGFDPIILNERYDDVNNLLLNKMINKEIIKITI